jgi:hypothetical protein
MSGRYGFCFLWLLIFGSAGVHAQQAAEVPSYSSTGARERTLLAQSYASERLWVWQRRLNLQEWNVSVVVAPASELKPKTLGNVHWELDKKIAIIRVLDPADYRLPFNEMLQDIEFTVVHELIHLELAPVLSDLHRSDANRRDEEHAVNHVADALLNLGRKP